MVAKLLVITGSIDGLPPMWCQAFTWIIVGYMSIWPLWTNFSKITIKQQTFSLNDKLENVVSKMLAILSRHQSVKLLTTSFILWSRRGALWSLTEKHHHWSDHICCHKNNSIIHYLVCTINHYTSLCRQQSHLCHQPLNLQRHVIFHLMVWLQSQHGCISASILKCGMELLINPYTSAGRPLKFGNGWLILSHTLLSMWLFIIYWNYS